MVSAVLFDFDGTLVHTAPGILAGFTKVLAAEGIEPVDAVDERVIGPPLTATLKRLTGLEDGPALEHLATAFKATYDADGVLDAYPYPALYETLSALARAGCRSFVVTNKRQVPARAIADRLGITPYLTAVYSPDSVSPPSPRKRALVAHVLAAHGIDARDAVVVGDSAEDADAAHGNALRFVAARYGYGTPLAYTEARPAAELDRLGDLPGVLQRLD